MYLSVKISQKSFNIALEHLVELRKIEKKVYTAQHDIFEVKKGQKITLYAMRGEGIFCDRTLRNYDYTLEKLKKVRKLLGTIQKIPEVHLIGLSGSCTMGNADKQDDIDIFIITAPGRLWTARFLILLIAALSGQKRHRTSKKAPDKACFNLFFDGLNVRINTSKRNAYIAHEVLQMKPIGQIQHIWQKPYKLNRAYKQRESRAYSQFIKANSWVFDYFPNYDHAGMGIGKSIVRKVKNPTFNFTERILGIFQLMLIRSHTTSEIISDYQLWFFPQDFQRKMKGRM